MKESEQLTRMSTVRIETQFEQVKVNVPPKPHEPTKEERQFHEAIHCPISFCCEVCVKATSPDGRHTKQLVDTKHIPVIEFDHVFATDTLRDPNTKISMMIATDSMHGSNFAVVARRTGGQDDCVIQSFQNFFDRLDLVKAELKCDQEQSTLDVANAVVRRYQSTNLVVTATPKGSKGSLGRGERATFDNSGTAASISGSLIEIQNKNWT